MFFAPGLFPGDFKKKIMKDKLIRTNGVYDMKEVVIYGEVWYYAISKHRQGVTIYVTKTEEACNREFDRITGVRRKGANK